MASFYNCLDELFEQYVEATSAETGNLRVAARLTPILMRLFGYLHKYYSAYVNENDTEKAEIIADIEDLFEGESIVFDTETIFD